MANANCSSRGPAREKKIKMNCCRASFFDGHRVVHDERLLCYHTRNIFQVDGYLFRSVTQLVKQMCCLLPEWTSYDYLPELGGKICPNWGVNCPPDPPSRTPMPIYSIFNRTLEKECYAFSVSPRCSCIGLYMPNLCVSPELVRSWTSRRN